MQPRHTAPALAAMLMLTPAAALATATAHIVQGPVTYTLVDLDKNDGVAPWISFQPLTNGWEAHGGISIARAVGDDNDVSYGDDLGTGFLSMAYQAPHQRGMAALSGAAAAGSMRLEASAQTEAVDGAYSRMDVSVGAPRLQFLLSPNTGVLLRSTAQAEGSVSSMDGVEDSRSVSWLDIMIAIPDGTTTFMSKGANSEASLEAGYPLAYNEAQLVELEFENGSGGVASGYISAYAWAWTYAVPVAAPPVPEPSLLAMLVPGLLLAGCARRLRKSAAPTPVPPG